MECRSWKPADEELEALLSAYIRIEAKPGTPEREAQEIAFDDVQYLVERNADAAWRLAEIACRAQLTDVQMAFVAAGLLEDLLAYHGDVVFDRLEEAARRDQRMRLMLAMVWQGLMDAAMWDRVQSLRSRLSISPL